MGGRGDGHLELRARLGGGVWVVWFICIWKRVVVANSVVTVNTNVTLVYNLNTNINVNVTANGTIRTRTHRPRVTDGVRAALVLNTTLSRTATVCNLVNTVLVVFVIGWSTRFRRPVFFAGKCVWVLGFSLGLL